MSRPGGKRKPKFQYSIPMHSVERLPLIREESPIKSYDNTYGIDAGPYDYNKKSVRFLPPVTSVSPQPPFKPWKRLRSPLDVDHTALKWLVSDYMAYARDSNEDNYYLPDIRHSSTCWCCVGRNIENFAKRNNSTSYEELLASKRKQQQKQRSDYEQLLLSRRQNVEPLTYEPMFLPFRDSRYVMDPSDTWAPQRRAPSVRMVPREYIISSVANNYDYQNLDDYIMRLNHSDNSAPSRNLLDADDLYQASMNKLRRQVQTFDRNYKD